jgi:hypothetical protein
MENVYRRSYLKCIERAVEIKQEECNLVEVFIIQIQQKL